MESEYFNLTSPDHVNLKFIRACDLGDLDEVRYWLSDLEIPLRADINAENNMSLKTACIYGHQHVIEYLIVEKNMFIDEKTRNWLNGDNTSKAIFKFALKLIQVNDLSNALNAQKEEINKPKLKI